MKNRLRGNNFVFLWSTLKSTKIDLAKLNGTPTNRLDDVSKDESEPRMASNEGASYSSQCPKSEAKKWPSAESITELGYAFGFHIAVLDILHEMSHFVFDAVQQVKKEEYRMGCRRCFLFLRQFASTSRKRTPMKGGI